MFKVFQIVAFGFMAYIIGYLLLLLFLSTLVYIIIL